MFHVKHIEILKILILAEYMMLGTKGILPP